MTTAQRRNSNSIARVCAERVSLPRHILVELTFKRAHIRCHAPDVCLPMSVNKTARDTSPPRPRMLFFPALPFLLALCAPNHTPRATCSLLLQVKGPSDRLSDRQTAWLRILDRGQALVGVCHVAEGVGGSHAEPTKTKKGKR